MSKRRVGITLTCLLLLLSVACRPSTPVKPSQPYLEFLNSWSKDATRLRSLVTGSGSDSLIETVQSLKRAGLKKAEFDPLSPSPVTSMVKGTSRWIFEDETVLSVPVRARVSKGRIVAEPSSIALAMESWGPITVQRFGEPERGEILSREGTLIAEGPLGARIISAPGLRPASMLIDAALDTRLKGRQGLMVLSADTLIGEVGVVPGEDVRTSIDDALQEAALLALGGRPGGLVALDPATGGIRGLASNDSVSVPGPSAAGRAHPSGSTFKMITAAAALHAKVIKPTDLVQCPSRILVRGRVIATFRSESPGKITFKRAFAISCNTAFAALGRRLGPESITKTAKAFGLDAGAVAGGESGEVTPPRDEGEVAQMSFGGSNVIVSPIRLAGIAASIGQEGRLVTPNWDDLPQLQTRLITRAEALDLLSMMEAVVTEDSGKRVAIPGLTIAAKTGTAEVIGSDGQRVNDAWFVALAPSRQAKVAVACWLPSAGVGGEEGGPIVRSFISSSRSSW